MTHKTILASVSALALLASPLAAQESEIDRSGTPAEEVVQGDESTSINAETQKVDESGAGNVRAGAPAEDTVASAAGPDSFAVETVDSIAMTLDDTMMDPSSPWVGKPVTTIDGTPLGTIEGVYNDGNGMSYANVMLDEKLGLDADSFLVAMSSDVGEMEGIQLPYTKVEFETEMASKVGTEPGSDASGSDG